MKLSLIMAIVTITYGLTVFNFDPTTACKGIEFDNSTHCRDGAASESRFGCCPYDQLHPIPNKTVRFSPVCLNFTDWGFQCVMEHVKVCRTQGSPCSDTYIKDPKAKHVNGVEYCCPGNTRGELECDKSQDGKKTCQLVRMSG